MAGNASLGAAKKAANDEFYTQYSDIQAEMNAYIEYDRDVFRGKTVLCPCDDPKWSNFTKYFARNFEKLGLKKLISTSYAKGAANRELSLFDEPAAAEEDRYSEHGKLFVLDGDANGSGSIDFDDIEYRGLLAGDGDFRSAEVTRLRDEADIIVTNPPFSLFREFLAWIVAGQKKFIIIGNVNAITYKEVFPLLKDNKMWLGYSIHSGDRKFNVPDDYPLAAAGCGIDEDGKKFIRVKGVRWFTNLDHGGRHDPLVLDTMTHNLKYNKKLRKKLEKDYGKIEYPHYDNYDAIEVPFTECIPSDYDGVMGVPITFMDKYNPEQFEIVGADNGYSTPNKTYTHKQKVIDGKHSKSQTGAFGSVVRTDFFGQGTYFDVGYPVKANYKRIFIKAKGGDTK